MTDEAPTPTVAGFIGRASGYVAGALRDWEPKRLFYNAIMAAVQRGVAALLSRSVGQRLLLRSVCDRPVCLLFGASKRLGKGSNRCSADRRRIRGSHCTLLFSGHILSLLTARNNTALQTCERRR